ncbi:MAG: aminopeptidase [Spirochaetaceae bacterium]|jgi:leucyl aminopeptidase (aminopeptidase T)|nr:aminopeptidase [Spirochaetaceae bacterium]
MGLNSFLSVDRSPILRGGKLNKAARIAVSDVLKVKKGEQVLIVSNPESDVSAVAQAMYDAAAGADARPVLVYQGEKTQMDFADEAVIAAFGANPQVFVSLSAQKLGKDRNGIASPYTTDGQSWDHIFHYQLYGTRTCRAFWSPGTTVDSFVRTVPIDYTLLKTRCAALKKVLDKALSIHIAAPGGTDVSFGLAGRKTKLDDGDFSHPGQGGNLPAGEVFISPENGTACGTIVFDGSISLHDRDILIRNPIHCTLKDGFITGVSGGADAKELLKTITLAERNARSYEKQGKFPPGAGELNAKNARNIGEIGIGLNPRARVTGHMLEDEKAFETCHFAVGHNYDGDAPALIHLDGLVHRPTITAVLGNGKKIIIEEKGKLSPRFA